MLSCHDVHHKRAENLGDVLDHRICAKGTSAGRVVMELGSASQRSVDARSGSHPVFKSRNGTPGRDRVLCNPA